MRADDPRHGTSAGALAHYRTGSPLCEPCATAAYRAGKATKVRLARGERRLVPLGNEAWRLLDQIGDTAISDLTGMRWQHLRKIRMAGPEGLVNVRTRARILTASGFPTRIGTKRRLEALTALGWSMLALSEQTGVRVDTLKSIRRRDAQFISSHHMAAVRDAYEALHMKPAPTGASASRTKAHARMHGYAPPLAWEDIDDPAERPAKGSDHRTRDDIDEAVVLRVLAGERLRTTRAEKDEVVRRWKARGWPLAELERVTGWKAERYGQESAA